MKGEGSKVSKSSNGTRRDKNGGREGEGCFRLANTTVCQGCAEVLRIGKLLLSIHQRLCIYN